MNDLPDGLVLALAGRYTIEREIGFGGMAVLGDLGRGEIGLRATGRR